MSLTHDPIFAERIHDQAYAMLGGRWDVDVQNSKGKRPVWNVEPLQVASGYSKSVVYSLILNHKNPIFDFDRRNVKLLKNAGVNCHWRPVIWTQSYQDWCDRVEPQERIYDVAIIAIETPRRVAITNALKQAGLRVFEANKIYGNEATKAIKQSKVLLNVHRDSAIQAQPQLRLSWGFIAGALVVSESSLEPSYTGFFTEAPYDLIVNATIEAVNNFSEEAVKKQLENFKLFSSVLEKATWLDSI